MLTVAIMVMPILLFFYWLIPTKQTTPNPFLSNPSGSTISKGLANHPCDQISCGEIEYIESDRSIRGSVVYTMGGTVNCARKSLSQWKSECANLVYINGSTLVNQDNACYIADNNEYLIVLLNSEKKFESNYSSVPDIFAECPFKETVGQ